MPHDASAPARARDPFLDNARGILIALVVVGHTLECFDVIGDVLGGTLYKAIYSFHMAAFVIISGYLSRSYRNEPRQVKRLLTAMLVPYVIFQMVHEAGKALLLGQEFALQLVVPAWTLWFLFALMVWRLLTPVLRQLRHPLVFAVAISVIAPLDPDLDSTLSIGRLLGMLPFFVLGLVCTPAMLERVRSFRHRWLGALVLLAALACAFLLREQVSNSYFYLRSAYDEDAAVLFSVAVRLGALVVGVVGTLALLLVTPRGQSVLTTVGSRSLTIYLLHTVLLLPIRYADSLPGWIETWWGTLTLVGAGLLLTAVLATGIVGRLTRWLTDPPIGQYLVRPAQKEPAPPASR